MGRPAVDRNRASAPVCSRYIRLKYDYNSRLPPKSNLRAHVTLPAPCGSPWGIAYGQSHVRNTARPFTTMAFNNARDGNAAVISTLPAAISLSLSLSLSLSALLSASPLSKSLSFYFHIVLFFDCYYAVPPANRSVSISSCPISPMINRLYTRCLKTTDSSTYFASWYSFEE